MSIPVGHKKNFETLKRAVINDQLALMECSSIYTTEPAYVLCAVSRDDEGMYNIVPLAKLFDDNPYDEVAPPGVDE